MRRGSASPRWTFSDWAPLRWSMDVLPGLAICATIAMASAFISEHHGGPTLLYALLLGMVLHFLSRDAKVAPGLRLGSTTVLRIGVALLGARIGMDQIATLGFIPLVLVVVGVAGTLAFGAAAANILGVSRTLGAVSSGAVAICGASAALAIAAVLPKSKDNERETLFTVVAVTTLSTVAMIAYPILARALSFDDFQAGVLLGATIHDVAQVVGAGHLISPQAESVATYVKLMRVAMLVPVVMFLAWSFRDPSTASSNQHDANARPPVLPLFLVAFFVLVVANSFHLLPDALTAAMALASRWCLVIAIAALGMKTSLEDLAEVGLRPMLLVVAETAFLLSIMVLAIHWLL